MRHGSFHKNVSITLIVTFLLYSQAAFSSEPTFKILGDIVGSGKIEMQTASNKWIPLSDKAYPVVDGTHLRSGDGRMSIILRDGVRMEIGKNSDIVVSGLRGNYSINLNNGSVGFSVPQGVEFAVATPTTTVQVPTGSAIIQKVNLEVQENIRGMVTYDGKGTKVTSVSGTLMVKNAIGTISQMVSAGNAVYFAQADGGNRAIPVQLPEAAGEAGFGALGLVGLGVVAIGGIFVVSNMAKGGGAAASPSKP